MRLRYCGSCGQELDHFSRSILAWLVAHDPSILDAELLEQRYERSMPQP
jgi:hypothetical protein